MNEIKLIALYYYIDWCYDKLLCRYCQRHTKNNVEASFSDVELLTTYFYALIEEEKYQVKSIYRYTRHYLWSWFPSLPSYQAYNRRLNRLCDAIWAFQQLVVTTYSKQMLPKLALSQAAIDSIPIMLAKGPRSDRAKVARAIADKAYCPSKGQWYHGLKVHLLAALSPKQLPIPIDIELSKGSANDNTVFKEALAPYCTNMTIFADKIYDDRPSVEHLYQQQKVTLLASQRRRKYQASLKADQKILSKYVSCKRQPIEAFFNWLIEKTKIQVASKVRSLKGALVFIHGKIAAAILNLYLCY